MEINCHRVKAQPGRHERFDCAPIGWIFDPNGVIQVGEDLSAKLKRLLRATRNDDLLKLKTYLDAEARVLKIISGKKKFQGMMGAILVENEEGIKFKIGSGFSDSTRKNPPAIGSIITYKYYGKTKDNKPRFASFLMIRADYNFVYR